MSSNDTDGIANSVDPDQTAPLWFCWFDKDILLERKSSMSPIRDNKLIHYSKFDRDHFYLCL